MEHVRNATRIASCRIRFPASRSARCICVPDGRGTVRLASPDPLAPPADPVRLPAHRLRHAGGDCSASACPARSPRSRRCNPMWWRNSRPARRWCRDADLQDYVRQSGVSNQHPTSSCAMGHGPNTVVDPRLRVHGIDGLRVADASIMPVAVGGNTNAPTIMIGEKCAAMILEDEAATPARTATKVPPPLVGLGRDADQGRGMGRRDSTFRPLPRPWSARRKPTRGVGDLVSCQTSSHLHHSIASACRLPTRTTRCVRISSTSGMEHTARISINLKSST